MLKLFVLWLAFYVQSSLSFTAKLTPYTSGKHHSCQQKSFLMSNNQKDSSWLSSDKFKACAWNKIPVVLAPIVTWTGAAIAAPLPNKGPLTQATITPTKKPVKGFMRLLNKIVFGSATSSRSLIVGDVSGGAVGLLHALRSVVAVSLFFMVGAFMVKFESISGKSKFQNELLREQKYREEMYIDAVRDIVAKLENPKLRSQVKIDLQKQLQELDSQGIIRQFLKSGSKTPPDLSEYIGKSGRVRNPTATSSVPQASRGSRPLDDSPRPLARRTQSVAPAAGASTDDSIQILQQLERSLKGKLSPTKSSQLIQFLETRLAEIADRAKRTATLTKIAQRIGDEQYWINYANTQL